MLTQLRCLMPSRPPFIWFVAYPVWALVLVVRWGWLLWAQVPTRHNLTMWKIRRRFEARCRERDAISAKTAKMTFMGGSHARQTL